MVSSCCSYLYSHFINWKHFIPTYSCYLSHIYTDQPNWWSNWQTTIYHCVTLLFFPPLLLKLFCWRLCPLPASLPPPAGIFCHPEFSLKCQTLTENFDVLHHFWWESTAPAAHFVATCVTLACFFNLKMYVRPDEISRQPQHTHQGCDVERAAKYCPPVPIIWAIAL